MALDVVCRIYIIAAKLNDAPSVNTIQKAVPTCIRPSFVSLESCIELFKDMRIAVMNINQSNPLAHVYSIQSKQIYISTTIENRLTKTKQNNNPIWVDFNWKNISYIELHENNATFMKLGYDSFNSVNYNHVNYSMQVRLV